LTVNVQYKLKKLNFTSNMLLS